MPGRGLLAVEQPLGLGTRVVGTIKLAATATAAAAIVVLMGDSPSLGSREISKRTNPVAVRTLEGGTLGDMRAGVYSDPRSKSDTGRFDDLGQPVAQLLSASWRIGP